MGTNVVFGTGSTDAKIMIIGEAPGYQEDKSGKPFVGKSGKILMDKLAKAGVMRSHCYMTNVIKEKPYKNNIKPFIDVQKNKTSEKADKYIDMLREEIERVNPNIIVAVGSTALWTLTRHKSITKWRGSLITSDFAGGRKVLPIIHPAASIHMYIYGHFIEKDLLNLRELAKSPTLDKKDREYVIEPAFLDSINYLKRIPNITDEVGFDIEIYNSEVSCISFAPSETNVICIPFTKGARNYFDPDQEKEIWEEITKVLEDPNMAHIAQNATFDVSFLFRKYGIRTTNVHDTMVAAGVAFPDFPKGLDFLTSIYTDVPYYKDDGKFKNPNVLDRDFWMYNAKDSVVLPEIMRKQIDELKQLSLYNTYVNQVSLIPALVYMMERGIKMDVDQMKSKYGANELMIQEKLAELNARAGTDLNPNSPKQLKEYFYETKGLKPITEKGKVTTNELALRKLSSKGHTEAKLILELRQLKTMNSRYYGMKLDSDNRIRCSFNPVGTSTGRLSSSKTIFGTGANMQNQPSDMKKVMRPDPEYIAYEIDLSQAENRVVAYIGPDWKMIDAFETGADIHSRTAGMIFDMDEEESVYLNNKLAETGDKQYAAPIGHGDKSHRFWGKMSNHAFNYDLGYVSFARKFELPRKDAQFIHGSYHKAYKGVKKMHEMIRNKLSKGRRLTNLKGRTRLFMDRWGDTLFKEAYAYIPQSTVADVINQHGVIEIYYHQEKYPEVELLNQVHDSIIFQVPRSAGVERHYEILRDLCVSLETTLEWHGREFTIPAEVTMMFDNFKNGIEIGKLTLMEKSVVTDHLSQHITKS